MQIRPYSFGQSDLQEILRIEAASFKEQSKPHFMRQTVDLFPNLTFLAVDQNKTVGFISGGIGLQRQAWLLSIATLTKGQGVGALLLERLLRTLEDNGAADHILLTVDPTNQAALHLFETWGWKKTSSVNSYFTEDDSRLLLCRAL